MLLRAEDLTIGDMENLAQYYDLDCREMYDDLGNRVVNVIKRSSNEGEEFSPFVN